MMPAINGNKSLMKEAAFQPGTSLSFFIRMSENRVGVEGKDLFVGAGSALPFIAVFFSVVLTVFRSVKKRDFYAEFHGSA
jgi:hypothetical protein